MLSITISTYTYSYTLTAIVVSYSYSYCNWYSIMNKYNDIIIIYIVILKL